MSGSGIRLHTLPHAFVLTARGGACVSVSRSTGLLTAAKPPPLPSGDGGTPVRLVLGLLPLPPSSALLLLVTGCETAASLVCGAPVLRATRVAVLRAGPRSAEADRARALLSGSPLLQQLYWSDDADATATASQAAQGGGAAGFAGPMAYNAFAAAPFLGLAGGAGAPFVRPAFRGWAGCAPAGGGLSLAVFMRRHTGRPGTRFFARGADGLGRAAQHVESEQLVSGSRDGGWSAWVTVRGSAPVAWAQPPTLAPTPPLALPGGAAGEAAHVARCRAHLEALRRAHAPGAAAAAAVSLLSLLRPTGREGPLAAALRRACAAPGVLLPNTPPSASSAAPSPSAAADELLEVNLSALGAGAALAAAAPALARHGVTSGFRAGGCGALSPAPPPAVSFQSGLLRTNCLDSCDRTNAAQAALAGWAAARLQAPPPAAAPAAGAAALAAAVAALWRRGGDAASCQYAGSGCQTRDRSGRGGPQPLAALRDGALAALRHVRNNHRQATECDAEALLLGRARRPAVPRGGGEGGGAAGAAGERGPPPSLASRALAAARRVPVLQAALLFCGARAVAALAAAGAGAGAGAEAAAWAAAAWAVTAAGARFGRLFVARPALLGGDDGD